MEDPGSALVLEQELVPRKLLGRLYRHEIETPAAKIPCWTYLTHGLPDVGQDEIRLTLQIHDGNPTPPPEPWWFFKQVHRLAEQGNLVVAYHQSGFGGELLGFGGLLYAPARPLPGINSPPGTLQGVFLKRAEFEEQQRSSPLRALARLGHHYSFFPWPEWSDSRRPDLSKGAAERDSLLRRLGRVWAGRAFVWRESEWVVLSVPESFRAELTQQLERVPDGAAVALVTGLDPGCRACLVWWPGQAAPMAITDPSIGTPGQSVQLEEGSPLRIGGAFLVLAPGAQPVGVQMCEDGFAAVVSDLDWRRIKQAVASGESVTIAGTEGRLGFRLEPREEGYLNPVDGQVYWSNWYRAEPTPGLEHRRLPARFHSEVRLLTSESELWVRTSAKALADFLNSAEDRAVDVLAAFPGAATLLIQFDCTPDRNEVRLAYRGPIPESLLRQIQTELDWRPPLAPSGPVSVQLEIRIDQETTE